MRLPALLSLSFTASAVAEPKLEFAFGILAEQRGDQAAAAAAIEKARAADPAAFPLVTRVAWYKQGQGDIEGASTLYREFAKSHPQRLDAQLEYADFLRNSSPDDDFAAKMARDILEAALKTFPGSLGLRQRLFRIYEGLEQRDRSTAIFETLAKPDASPGDILAPWRWRRHQDHG